MTRKTCARCEKGKHRFDVEIADFSRTLHPHVIFETNDIRSLLITKEGDKLIEITWVDKEGKGFQKHVKI